MRALFEIAPEHIGESSLRLVTERFGEEANRRALLELSSLTMVRVEHPLNADYWHERLESLPLTERDLSWSEHIRHNQGHVKTFVRLLEEFCRGPDEPTAEIADRLRLLAMHSTWTLTSTVKTLRDKATRALYWYGRRFPEHFFLLVRGALKVNDPYVPERMLAAAYGVAMARQYDFKDETFVQSELPRWGRELYEVIFAPEAPHGTTHILTRDYARRTIDIAVSHHPHLLSHEQRSRTIPPFEEGGIREWGESEDRDKCRDRSGGAPLQMAFENYILGRLGRDRQNYDYEHEEYKKVRANVYWRIYDLGYSLEDFGEVDNEIFNQQNWRYRREEEGGKTERYGKKYSWIAYFEIAGLRQDQDLLPDRYKDYLRVPDVDIDPSFPGDLEVYELVREDFLGDRDVAVEEWIVRGEPPKFTPYFVVDELRGEAGHWVLLDGAVNQEDPGAKRSFFAYLRGFIVNAEEAGQAVQMLGRQTRGGRWLPEIPEDHYTFGGEVPWCGTYPENDWDEMDLVTGTKTILESQEELVLLRDGERLSEEEETNFIYSEAEHIMNSDEVAEEIALRGEGLEWEVRTFEVEKEVDEFRVFEVLVPVRNNAWEDYHSAIVSGRNVSTPAKQIAEHLGLVNQPQTFDLYEKDGKLASMTFGHSETFSIYQDFTYIRKDLLDRFLQDTGTRLIYVVWGERQFYSTDFGERDAFVEEHTPYERFEYAQAYEAG